MKTMDLSIESTLDFGTLSLSQKVAMKGVMKGGCTLILGGAGVGKSHLIGIMQRHLPHFIALGTSGASAANIDSVTLDSFLGFIPGINGLIEFSHLSEERKQAIRKLKTILFDEASFLRIDKFERIDQRLREIRGIDRPFGGLQIVLAGDFCQLSPVLTKHDRYHFEQRYEKKRYCFESPVYEAAGFTPYLLDSYIRQSDPTDQAILKHLRISRHIPQCIKKLQQRTHPRPFETGVSLYTNNKMVEAENIRRTAAIAGKQIQYHAEISGAPPPKELQVPQTLSLKTGLRVMTTINRPHDGYVNGDTGTIRRCLKGRIVVETDRGYEIEVRPALREITEPVWTNGKLESQVTSSIRQMPIKIAYAMTIHKSQGLTMENVNITLDRNGYFPFSGYVAMSRARRIKDIHIRHPLSPACFSTNPIAVDFTVTQSKLALSRREADMRAFSIAG